MHSFMMGMQPPIASSTDNEFAGTITGSRIHLVAAHGDNSDASVPISSETGSFSFSSRSFRYEVSIPRWKAYRSREWDDLKLKLFINNSEYGASSLTPPNHQMVFARWERHSCRRLQECCGGGGHVGIVACFHEGFGLWTLDEDRME